MMMNAYEMMMDGVPYLLTPYLVLRLLGTVPVSRSELGWEGRVTYLQEDGVCGAVVESPLYPDCSKR
jgi:hypothetical protein